MPDRERASERGIAQRGYNYELRIHTSAAIGLEHGPEGVIIDDVNSRTYHAIRPCSLWAVR
jgi:hypothetical protein